MFEVIDKFIGDLLKQKPGIEEGIDIVNAFLQIEGNNDALEVDSKSFCNCYDRFNSWFERVLLDSPIPSDIQSLYFGMFEKVKKRVFAKDSVEIEICLSGSRLRPGEDMQDWPCDTSYLPRSRYANITCFSTLIQKLTKSVKSGENSSDIDIEAILSILILSVFVYNALYENRELILQSSPDIETGFGFDGGDIYLLGKIKSWKPIPGMKDTPQLLEINEEKKEEKGPVSIDKIPEIVKDFLVDSIKNNHVNLERLDEFQRYVFKAETISENKDIEELIRELAYDLDFYEPDPEFRSESPSLFDESRAINLIEEAYRKLK